MATLFVDPYRPAVLNYLGQLSLGTFRVTQQYPWTDNREPLYFNNRKTIYVDNPNTEQTVIADFLDQSGLVDETTTVSIYFVTDAKQLPQEYDDVVSQIKTVRTLPNFPGVVGRTVRVITSFHADDMLTTFDFSFKKIITV